MAFKILEKSHLLFSLYILEIGLFSHLLGSRITLCTSVRKPAFSSVLNMWHLDLQEGSHTVGLEVTYSGVEGDIQ